MLLCPGIPGIPLDDDSDEGAFLGAEWERAEAAGDVDGLASVTQRVWGRAGATPEAIEQFRSSARAVLATGYLEQDDPPVFGRLGEIAVPTSLLVGDADFPPLIEADKAAAARIPGCELIVVPGMDHCRCAPRPGAADVMARNTPPPEGHSQLLRFRTDPGFLHPLRLPATGVESAVGAEGRVRSGDWLWF